MSTIIAIDPGYAVSGKGSAVAIVQDDRLIDALFIRPEDAPKACAAIRLKHVDAVVWECPQIDARTRSCAPEAVQLAAVGGTLAGLVAGRTGCTRVIQVTPSRWKGSQRKPQAHARMWAALSDAERDVLGGAAALAEIESAKKRGALDRWAKPGGSYYRASWHTHNLLDAAGIGLWYVGRVKK